MKKVYLIVLYLTFNITNGQSISPELIKMPVSPEAARLGNFEDIPVNMNNGLLNNSIELFSGNVGEYQFPINLNYNYSGFKLEEKPSLSGLGWILNVGGVITREVRGLPDEHRNGYYANNQIRDNYIKNYIENDIMSYETAQYFINGEYDSEADKYNLSVNGINFSFKIGLDGTPVFLSKHNFKLEIIKPINQPLLIDEFVLTDTNANKYYFNQIETTINSYGNEFLHYDTFQNYRSSWYLSKIVLNNQSEITFDYENDIFNNFSFYARGTKRPAGVYHFPISTYQEGASQDIINRKILKSIQNENFKVLFYISNSQNQKVYNSIEIKDLHDKIIDKYDFIYINPRNNLSKINKNNSVFYEFSYYEGVNYPRFIEAISPKPWSQDDWGYYNGVNNQYGLSIPETGWFSNKDVSFDCTVIGALKTIKYPTGGQTELIYEQNTIPLNLMPDDSPNPNYKIHLKFNSDNLYNAPLTKEKYYRKTFSRDVVATLTTKLESHHQAFIELLINKVPENGGAIPHVADASEFYYNKIPHLRNFTQVQVPIVLPKLFEVLDDGYTTSSKIITRTSNGKFIIPAGTYEFNFKAIDNRKKSHAEVLLTYYDSKVADTLNRVQNKLVGGIRIKKKIDYPIVMGNGVVVNYDYNDEKGVSKGRLLGKHVNSHTYIQEECRFVMLQMQCESQNVTDYVLSHYSELNDYGSPVNYNGIKEYREVEEVLTPLRILCDCNGNLGSDPNSEASTTFLGSSLTILRKKYPQGFITKQFTSNRRYRETDYPMIPPGKDKSYGEEVSKRIYRNTNFDLTQTLVKEELKSYIHSNNTNWNSVYINSNHPPSLKFAYKILTNYTAHHQDPFQNCFKVKSYRETDSESYLSNFKIRDYSENNAIEIENRYSYNSYLKLNKLEEIYGQNDILSKEIYYPYDFTDVLLQNMVSRNVLDPVVELVTKRNNVLIESVRLEYINIFSDLYKPIIRLKNKNGDGILKSALSYQYDVKGNLLSYRNQLNYPDNTLPIGHPSTFIIWGYNLSLPIAKIESTLPFSLNTSLILSIQQKSNEDTDSCNLSTCKEEILRKALNGLRDVFPEALITTYTYNPLIGITSITDPKGDTVTYHYDAFNRLKEVRDKDNAIINEHTYHYRP